MGESRLALARLAVYGSTFRAGLRRIVRRDLAKVSSPLFQFVIEQSFEDMPTLIENRPVETGLLTHLASGFAQRALGAGGHVPDVQIFDHNRAKPLGQVKADSVMPVLTNAGASGAQGGDAAPGFGVPRAAAFATRENLLGASLTMLKRVKTGRNEKVLARAEGQRLGHPSVNTDGGQGVERNIMFNRQRERDMPAVRGKTDRSVIDFTDQRARAAVSHPADLRQPDFGPLVIQFADTYLTALKSTRKSKRIVAPLFSWVGVVSDSPEVVLISTLKITQSLLLAGLRDGRYPALRRPVSSRAWLG